MEELFFSSACLDPTSYCSFGEQREALEQSQSARRNISRDSDTYIYTVIPVLTHWIAVQVTITPFDLDKYPGQTFFSSRLRYGPCCRQAHDEDTLVVVRQTVQKVVEFFYQPVSWDYSGQYCTLDQSNNTDTEQCIPVITSRLRAYTSSTYNSGHAYATESVSQPRSIIASRSLDDQLIVTQSTHLDRPFSIQSLLSPADFSHSQGNNTSIIRNSGSLVPQSSSTCVKRKVGDTGLPEEVNRTEYPAKRPSHEQQDAQRAQNIVAWVKEGLQNLSLKDFPRLVTPFNTVLCQPEGNREAQACADYLWGRANETENKSTTFVWSLRFTAACAMLVAGTYASPSESGQSSQGSRQSKHNWRCGAGIMNWVVNEMLPTWKAEAYLLYHVFAAKGQTLSPIARLSQARQRTVASAIVRALKTCPAPSRIEGVSIFDPTRVLHDLLPQRSYAEICDAIGLPLALTRRMTESQESSANLTFCHLALTLPSKRLNLRDTSTRRTLVMPSAAIDPLQDTSTQTQIDTPRQAASHQYDEQRLTDVSENQALCEMQLWPDSSSLVQDSATEALSRLGRVIGTESLQQPGTMQGGDELTLLDMEEQVANEMIMDFEDPSFSDLWTSSLCMDTSAIFDEMWNSSFPAVTTGTIPV